MTPTSSLRRQVVLNAAKQIAVGEPPVAEIAARLLPWGVDLCDPQHMVSLSVLSDCVRFGLSPSPTALEKLGAA